MALRGDFAIIRTPRYLLVMASPISRRHGGMTWLQGGAKGGDGPYFPCSLESVPGSRVQRGSGSILDFLLNVLPFLRQGVSQPIPGSGSRMGGVPIFDFPLSVLRFLRRVAALLQMSYCKKMR